MPLFALLQRRKTAREQSTDRGGGEPSSKRSKRGAWRELFRWSSGTRTTEERQLDTAVLPPLLETAISGDGDGGQRPPVPSTAVGPKPAARDKTPTEDDVRKLFAGAPQFSLLQPLDASQPPQPRVAFPWDADPRTVHGLTDCAMLPHPVFSLSTARPHLPPTDEAAADEGSHSRYDIGAVEVPSAISEQGLEPGTVGYEYFMMLPFADKLEELWNEEAGGSDYGGETSGLTAVWKQRGLLRESPEGGNRIGMRSVEANVIATRLQELGHLYHGSEGGGSAPITLDIPKEQYSVQLYTQLFTRILYPPDRVHNADADDPYSLKVQIEALIRALSATGIFHDFSIVETRLRLGELLFGDPAPGIVKASAVRRWLLLQILLSSELLVRLDAVAGIDGQDPASSMLESLLKFYGVLGRRKIEWDMMLARRWLENVQLSVREMTDADNHNRSKEHNNHLAHSPLATTTTTQDPAATKKKGTSAWSWFSQNASPQPPAAAREHTDTDPDDIPIIITSWNPQRQISGLLHFAEALGWPGVDTLRQELEARTLGIPTFLGADKKNAADDDDEGKEEHHTASSSTSQHWALDTYLASVILPGPSLSHHLMAALFHPSPFPLTKTNTGLIYSGKTYWNKHCIVGKVLAGTSGAREVGGWIAAVELDLEGLPDHHDAWITVGPEELLQSRETPPAADLAPLIRDLPAPPPSPPSPPPQPQQPPALPQKLTLTPSSSPGHYTATLGPFALTHNPPFLTSFPCLLAPSQTSHPLPAHIPFSFLAPLPTAPVRKIDWNANEIIIVDARAGRANEVLARAWCAAAGARVVLIARERSGACLGCAVREGWVVGGGEYGGGVVVVWA